MKNIYKIYLLALFAISLLQQKTYGQFIQDLNLAAISNYNLSCIHFPNDSNGFVGGWGGVILHTSDRGDSWTVKNPSALAGKNITSIFFVNETTGFVTTSDVTSTPFNGSIFRTDNAGVSWVLVKNDTFPLSAITFPSMDTGYAVGYRGKRFRTIDGGNVWDSIGNQISINTMLYDVKFLDNTTGYVTRGDGRIFKTTNSGVTWTQSANLGISAGPSNRIWVFDQNNTFWMLNSKLFHTTDGGTTWTEKLDAGVINAVPVSLFDLYFVNNSVGFVAGFNGHLFRTMDGGLTWDRYILETKMPIRFPIIGGIYFKDESHGIVVADSGVVAKFAFADSVKGRVMDRNFNPITSGEVLLLHKRPVDVKMDTVAVYNLLSSANGDYHFFNVPAGNYIILAVPDSTDYPKNLATYYDSVILWKNAKVLNIIQDEAGLDIIVRDTFPKMNGTGTIKGQVREGNYFGGKVMITGDPIKNINVALITNGKPVGIDMTDDSGRFEFTKVNNGVYNIHVDIPGTPVDSNNIVIGDNDTAFINAVADSFLVHIDTLNGVFINTAFVQEGLKFHKVYPNPIVESDDYLYIDIDYPANRKYDLSLKIFNLLGKEIKQLNNLKLNDGKNILKIKSSELKDNISLLGIFVNNENLPAGQAGKSIPAYYSKIVKLK